MKAKRNYGLMVFSILFMLIGCGGGGSTTSVSENDSERITVEKENSWTIMIYGSANNNLTPQLIFDMLEMSGAGSVENFNIIVQADFDDKSLQKYKTIAKNETVGVGRYRIQKDKAFPFDIPQKKLTTSYLNKGYASLQKSLVEKISEQNMDDQETLENFVDWSMEKYPAKHYGLIMWGHGGQWSGGFGYDTDNLTDSPFVETMNVKEIAQTLNKSLEGKKLDFLSFDACLMGGLEVVGEFSGLTEILIANPQVDYGLGMDYKNTLSWLKDNPDTNMTAFAKKEVTVWKEHHSTSLDNTLAVHAAYNVDKASVVEENFNLFTNTLINNYTTELAHAIPSIRRHIVEYNKGLNDLGEQSFSQYVDLTNIVGCFMKQYTDCLAPEDIPDTINNGALLFASSTKGSVIALAKGSTYGDNVSGISIWYPIDGIDNIASNIYADKTTLGVTTPWVKFLKKVRESRETDTKAPALFSEKHKTILAPQTLKIGQTIPINFKLEDDNDTYAIDIQLWKKEKTDLYSHMGSLSYLNLDNIGQKEFNRSWDAKIYFAKENAKKIPLGYQFMSPPILNKGVLINSITYINALYVPPNSSASEEVTLMYSGQTQRVEVAIKHNKNPLLAPKSIFLEPQGKLYPLSYTINESRSDNFKKSLLSNKEFITIPQNGLNEIKIINDYVEKGEYLIKIFAEDNYGQKSKSLNMEVVVE